MRTRWMPRPLLMAIDAGLINAGIFLAFHIRYHGLFPEENFRAYVGLALWITLIGLVIFRGLNLYATTPIDLAETMKRVGLAVVLLGIATMAISFWFRGFAFPRSVLLIAPALQFGLLSLSRAFFLRAERQIHGERPVLIVAAFSSGGHGLLPGRSSFSPGESSEETPSACSLGDEEISLIRRFFNAPKGWFRLHAVAPYHDMKEIEAEMGEVDAILLAPSVPENAKARVAALAMEHRKEIFVVPGLYEILLLNAAVGQVDDLPVMQVPPMGLGRLQRAAKRALDIAVGFLGLVLALPVMGGVALLIRTTCRGPILYRQERVGLGGRPFVLYKFRTMVDNAEAETGPVLATVDDPRLTPLGRWLRGTRLDEIPQLFNILKGEMSLVGPRPERPEFVNRLSDEITNYPYRLLVKPGLTGHAQVMGRYSTEAADKLRYDLLYIRNYSIFLDIKILLQTIGVVFSKGAARGVGTGAGIGEKRAALDLLDSH